MEAHQLRARRRAASLAVAGVLLGLGCAAATATSGGASVVLAQVCRAGPYCVTGQISDVGGGPVGGVKCVILDPQGQGIHVFSDARGVFLTDRLTAPPREIRFEKAGFATQVIAVPARAPRAAARLWVTLHRLSDAECTCEPNALFGGIPACPPARCP